MSIIPSIFRSKPKKKRFDKYQLIEVVSKTEGLEEISLLCVSEAGSDGVDTKNLNYRVAEQVFGNQAHAENAVKVKEITDHFHKLRVKLSKNGQIGFNKEQKVWYPKNLKARDLTKKEERFLNAKGLDAPGWISIKDKLEAVRWLHREFSDDEFEQFCCALLEHSEVRNLKVTEKRKGSGADGGLDGFGEYSLGDETIPIAFEAKRHSPASQIGSDICQKLVGAMMQNNIKHGFIITTATFSERSQEAIREYRENHDYQIELIDQDRMAEIMICKKDSPHGFGLHRTDKDFIYMNRGILKHAASK